jgi:hypothetical protein
LERGAKKVTRKMGRTTMRKQWVRILATQRSRRPMLMAVVMMKTRLMRTTTVMLQDWTRDRKKELDR